MNKSGSDGIIEHTLHVPSKSSDTKQYSFDSFLIYKSYMNSNLNYAILNMAKDEDATIICIAMQNMQNC